MTDKRKAASTSAKLQQQSGVSKPMGSGDCWAEVRVYTGSRFPAFINCAKPARSGHLTCHWHADREDAAQAAQRAQ